MLEASDVEGGKWEKIWNLTGRRVGGTFQGERYGEAVASDG